MSSQCQYHALSTEALVGGGSEDDHSPSTSAELRNACKYTSTPPYVFVECAATTTP